MKQLSQQQRQHFAYHNEAFDKAYTTQIYFCFDSKENGEEAFDYLQDVYSDECNYNAWSGWFGIGDKRDFYLGFVSADARDAVYNDLKNAVASIKNTNQYQDAYLTDAPETTDTGDTGKKTDLTTYIIIGAAAAIIIALLWKRKK